MKANGKYHERQSTLKCAIHAVNNFLQGPVFTKESFEIIAQDLFKLEKVSNSSVSYINPYKNVFGLGNYDVTVIEKALGSQGYEIKWWDMRKSFKHFDFSKEEILGFLINDRGEKGFLRDIFKIVQPNHWYSIRKEFEEFFDVDSRLEKPKKFINKENLIERMENIRKNDGFIFPIYKMAEK